MAFSQTYGADIQNGRAHVHGIANNGTTYTITGYATFSLEALSLAHNFRLKEVIDENDSDAALCATNANIEMDITFKPAADTKAAAAGIAVFLAPLTTVVLSNFKVAVANGSWIYVGGGKIDLTANDNAKQTLRVRRYVDSTQNTLLTTVAA